MLTRVRSRPSHAHLTSASPKAITATLAAASSSTALATSPTESTATSLALPAAPHAAAPHAAAALAAARLRLAALGSLRRPERALLPRAAVRDAVGGRVWRPGLQRGGP